jgi:hypothetical protein
MLEITMKQLSAKSAAAQIDAIIRQSKQVTADLAVLKHEIAGVQLPLSLRRDGEIAHQRLFLITQQAYSVAEDLSNLRKTLDGKGVPDEAA